jgi:undecaprenyl diphosphate synthase
MQVRFLGDVSQFSPDIKNLISTIEEETNGRSGLNLNIAMNYGSRAEITDAVKTLAKKAISGEIVPENINEKIISENLYTKGQPDIDLIIRTADEKRLSNFMLWQSAYAEFYFTDVLWPDFSENEFNAAINEYFSRIRRFGGE